MPVSVKQVIEDAKKLSAKEKALIAHCLIVSLETNPEEGVDEAWAKLAEVRYKELISGNVQPSSWEDIKKDITG